MKCPVCHATYRAPKSAQPTESNPCHRCRADLSPLVRLHDQAIAHHRHAIEQLEVGDLTAAITANNQAIALHSQHPRFHALAGQLWALQGDFEQAWRSWQLAQKFDPKNTTVSACLEILAQLTRTNRAES